MPKTISLNVARVDLDKARSDPDGRNLDKRGAEWLIRDLPKDRYPSEYRAVLYALATYLNDRKGSRAWPSTRTLAHASGAAIATVGKALERAEEDGLIYRMERTGQRSTRYVFFALSDLPDRSLMLETSDLPHRSLTRERSTPQITSDLPDRSEDTIQDTTTVRTQIEEEEEDGNQDRFPSDAEDGKRPGKDMPAPATLRDGGLGDGKIRDDCAECFHVRAWPCGCTSRNRADGCAHGVHRLRCPQGVCVVDGEHAPPVLVDRWSRRQECLKALGFTKDERQALYREYGDSFLLRRYRWTLKQGKRVKYPKRYFENSLTMPDIIEVELTPWDMKAGYGFPLDGVIELDRAWEPKDKSI